MLMPCPLSIPDIREKMGERMEGGRLWERKRDTKFTIMF